MGNLIGSLFMSPTIRRDPEVLAAVAESRRILAQNAALVRELAAIERALVRKVWKKRPPILL